MFLCHDLAGLLKKNKTLQNKMEVTVTPTFQLYFYALETLPPIWMSPSDYQSFIYFRAVSHKKKSI